MKQIDRDGFPSLLKSAQVKTRLARELRFSPEIITDWNEREMLAITTRSGAEGLLIIELEACYAVPYELTIGLQDKLTGRSKPVTCDFCYTWQAGGKAGRITFRRKSDDHTFTYLCCADLQCSRHVRTKTPESILSRTQLHEDMNTEQRIIRLCQKFTKLVETLQLQPINQ